MDGPQTGPNGRSDPTPPDGTVGSHGGRRHMSISGHGEGTAGPALHADVLAGLNDEQRAAAICFLTCASAATATPWNGTRCGRRVRSACTVGLGIAAAERP
jgi:hypothetical protein